MGFLTISPSGTDTIFLGNPEGISAYADQQTDAANGFILQLGQVANTLSPPTINPVFPDGPTAPAVIGSSAPSLVPVVWTAPSAPSIFVGTLDVSDFFVEPFEEDAPVLNFPTAPTAFSELSPDSPGIDVNFDYPDLDLTLPAAPSLLTLSIQPFDGITMPTVDAMIPELTAVAPSIREYIPGAQYTSTLLTALKASLEDRIISGGTGLSAEVENAIWERGREREARSYSDTLLELDRMAALGYSYPPGVYLDARLKAQTEMDYAARGHSREVMIKSAELMLDNVKHALDTSVTLEGNLLNYTNQVEQRLFESCKYATEAGIAIYNAQVQAYAAFLDAFKTRVQIYEAQVRGQLALVEVYKAQVEAEQAKAQINVALVEQYKAQIEAALSAVEVFKARIAAIQVRADVEKTKVEIYGEQIKAYVARINAYTAGVEGFRASIEAEASKQEAYKARVQAFAATVDAAGKQIDARIAAFRGNLDASTAAWDAYKSAYQAESAKAQAISAQNSAAADIYKAEVTGIVSYNETLTKQWQVTLDQAQRVVDIGVNAAKANAELYVTTRSLALDAAKVGAQVSAQLGASALNAINWSTSFNNSVGLSISNAYSNSKSESTNTNYNYSV